ncbi:uncharacterized protein LOC128263981 isoform X2 [Drosophila gunungcola]|uniref:uncharacterized protein LOC128263981 isoform X2 n=1 Tax=Drosophila gunungcola TaxID=103775 RepID=UPI0022E1D022|nr:uncharacterized protein LOC128263981 isoform X2 [Drosophila gunungcola]
MKYCFQTLAQSQQHPVTLIRRSYHSPIIIAYDPIIQNGTIVIVLSGHTNRHLYRQRPGLRPVTCVATTLEETSPRKNIRIQELFYSGYPWTRPG